MDANTSESTQAPDLAAAAKTLKDRITTAVKLLGRVNEDLEKIRSTVYVSITALRAPDGDAASDVANALDGVFVQLNEDVDDDVEGALKALDHAARACGGVATSQDHSDE